MKRELKILCVLFAFSPLWIASDNLSPWGFLIVLVFFTGISLLNKSPSRKFSLLIIKAYNYPAYLFLILSSIIALPIITQLVLGGNLNPENYLYAFKQISTFSIDINYVSLVFLLSFLFKPSYSGFALILLCASRASIVVSLFLYCAKFVFPRILKTRTLIIIFISLLVFSFVGIQSFIDNFAFSNSSLNQGLNQDLISQRSFVYKLLTYQSFAQSLSSENLGVILFGNGSTFDSSTLTITGHTLFGVIAKNGLLYIICSVIVLYLACDMCSLDSKILFIGVVLVSLVSMTAFFFVTPLCYSYSCLCREKRTYMITS